MQDKLILSPLQEKINSLLKSLKTFDKNKDYVVAIIIEKKGST
ncbi:MAG: hypothetical protein ACJAS9_001090 [Polaribacter sp.]|jgi:hypothetical protein